MTLPVKFGYQQDSGAFGALALPIDDAAIVNSRQEMFAHIDAFVKYKIEQMFLPLLGDLLMNTVRGYTTTFKPIEEMKKALLAGAIEEDAERHMIAFLHEVQRDLPAAIEKYKAEYPRYLLPTDTQTYANGRSLLTESEEAVILGVLPQGSQLTYATGPIGEYFRNFMQRCYERAKTLLALSQRFDGSSYESFSIEQFSRMAQVINGEVEGFKIEVIDPSEYYSVKLHTRTVNLYARHEPIYVAYEDLENLILISPYGGTDTKKVIKLTNMGQTAMVAKVGRTSPTEYAVNRADYSTRTQMTTPSTHEYSKADVGKEIRFEEMQKPTANSLPEIQLEVGDKHVLSVVGKFDGDFIEAGYTLNSVISTYINVVRNENNYQEYTITAIKAGTTMFNIIANNPAGSTPLEVDVSIT